MEAHWSGGSYKIDLNAIRDGNRAVSLVGFRGPQVVPIVGQGVTAVDEDGSVYDATVEAVLPDSRVYLRVKWATRRITTAPRDPIVFGKSRWGAKPDVKSAIAH